VQLAAGQAQRQQQGWAGGRVRHPQGAASHSPHAPAAAAACPCSEARTAACLARTWLPSTPSTGPGGRRRGTCGAQVGEQGEGQDCQAGTHQQQRPLGHPQSVVLLRFRGQGGHSLVRGLISSRRPLRPTEQVVEEVAEALLPLRVVEAKVVLIFRCAGELLGQGRQVGTRPGLLAATAELAHCPRPGWAGQAPARWHVSQSGG
jgi:hypothetical protein